MHGLSDSSYWHSIFRNFLKNISLWCENLRSASVFPDNGKFLGKFKAYTDDSRCAPTKDNDKACNKDQHPFKSKQQQCNTFQFTDFEMESKKKKADAY